MKRQLMSGQALVELILVMALAAIILPALLTGLVATRNGKPQQVQRAKAVAFLKESEEAVRSIRNASWSSLASYSTNTDYHTIISGSQWALASSTQTNSSNLTQQIDIYDVQRNTTGTIVASGGVVDPSTKKIVITISSTQPSISPLVSTMYLTRTGNTFYTDTTKAQFSTGTRTGTDVVSTGGSSTDGQVQLSAGGGGDWCNPGSYVRAIFDLPGSGVANAISATSSASIDYAYTTTGNNASGDAVDGVTISHTSPPIVANPSSNNEAKAYGIYVNNAASYVYFNENNPPNHTVRIARASDLVGVGYYDSSPRATGTSVYVSGATGYTTAGSALYSFDSTPQNNTPQKGTVSLAGTGNKVMVVGNNAYVATSSTTSQLQIINVSNPASMTVTKSVNLGNGQAGVDVFVNSTQTYAYVVTNFSTGKNDFFIIDLTNTNNIYGYQAVNSMNPKGITVVPGNKAIVVGSGGEEYQVFDITSPSSSFHCGGLSPSGVTSVNAVSSVIQSNGNVFSYILTDNSSAEFQVIQGGSGGQYATSGSFVSATFDAGSNVTFNRIFGTSTQPPQSTISAQVALAPAVSGSCSSVSLSTFVGPGGTSASTDTYTFNNGFISGPIPISYSGAFQNPARCFKYKVNFSTADIYNSPVLYDMSVNYSQ